ncbi:hypothetical protein M758_UG192500 [Ceratodon purpureus]|nr:hypothetical protein M758_UG192500 [Ceratodon purpureus]
MHIKTWRKHNQAGLWARESWTGESCPGCRLYASHSLIAVDLPSTGARPSLPPLSPSTSYPSTVILPIACTSYKAHVTNYEPIPSFDNSWKPSLEHIDRMSRSQCKLGFPYPIS